MLKPLFLLQKTYLDGIDKEGNCFILYTAKLKIFGIITIPYSSLIFSNAQHKLLESSQIKNTILKLENGEMIFENQYFKIKGIWKYTSTQVKRTLYRVQNKALEWNVHHAHTYFKIYFQNKLYEGLGYAETLELPFLPWKLPINTLKWGRFLAENFSLIWIEWKGEYPQQILYLNGQLTQNAHISEDKITIPTENIELYFEQKQIIKQAKLLTIAHKYKFLKFLFKDKFLESLEVKYKSKSILKQNDIVIAEGWSLYEVVIWKK
jgi:hypothetical protein